MSSISGNVQALIVLGLSFKILLLIVGNILHCRSEAAQLPFGNTEVSETTPPYLSDSRLNTNLTRVLRTHTRCAVIVCAVSYYNSIKLICQYGYVSSCKVQNIRHTTS